VSDRAATPAAFGLTTRDVAKRYRVGEDKVRAWIKAGVLAAINTADVACGRPRYVVTPEALAAFELARSATTKPAKATPKRRQQQGMKDFYPD
jgi:transposase